MGILLGLVVTGGLLIVLAWWARGPDPPARAPPAERVDAPGARGIIDQISVAAVGTWARRGTTCAAVNFGTDAPEVTETALSEHTPITTPGARRLCGLRYRISNRDGTAEVWVLGARAATGASTLNTKVLAQARLLDAGESLLLDVRLPRRLEQPLMHRLAVVALGGQGGDQGRRLNGVLAGLDGPVDPADWDRLLAELRAGGLDVMLLTHELRP